MSTPELPDDYFHTYIFVSLDAASCDQCDQSPDLLWAWEGIESGQDVAVIYTIRAVQYLKNAGWVMHSETFLCPACAAQRGLLGKERD